LRKKKNKTTKSKIKCKGCKHQDEGTMKSLTSRNMNAGNNKTLKRMEIKMAEACTIVKVLGKG
jgi:hypothetical protein